MLTIRLNEWLTQVSLLFVLFVEVFGHSSYEQGRDGSPVIQDSHYCGALLQ